MIEQNKPACPAGCRYCMVNYVPARHDRWSQGLIYGVNKTLTFVNPDDFSQVDSTLLRWDYVGYQGTHDPFDTRWKGDLEKMLDLAEEQFRKLVLVTKLGTRDLSLLEGRSRVQVVVSITGIEQPVERVSTDHRVRFAQRLADAGLHPLVLIHPYIHGLSDLSFLHRLVDYDIDISYKGFRYSESMANWADRLIPADYLREYKRLEGDEVMLGERDVLEQLDSTVGLCRVYDFRKYIHNMHNVPVTAPDPEVVVEDLVRLRRIAVVSSSDPANVWDSAYRRRLTGVA